MWKDAASLCEADFADHPVWEWRDNGGIEVARPASVHSIPAPEHDARVYIAATEFLTANGERYCGYCSPADPSGMGYTQPVIFTNAGPVAVWRDAIGAIAVADIVNALGIPHEHIFPLRIRCLVDAEEGRYIEVVDGA